MNLTPLAAATRLLQADNILLLTHRRPDGDTVGCAAALAAALRRLDKTVYVLPNPDITTVYADYLAPYLAPADFAPSFVAALDVAARNMLPRNAEPYAERIDLTVDHHPSQEYFARETCLDASAAACGEIVYELCRALDVMDGEIARALYLAIATDTGCFVYSSTSARTHRIAAALLEQEMDFAAINKRHFRTKTRVRMQLEAALIAGMALHDCGRIAIMTLPLTLMRQLGATEADADDIAALTGLLEGVDCGILLKELREGEWKISLRTGSRINASHVCARFGGGGHACAAGCTICGSAEDVCDRLLAALEEESHG